MKFWHCQGCEDLEEVLSERLQQLPAPLESAPSAGSQQEPPVVIPDDLPAERERVRLELPLCDTLVLAAAGPPSVSSCLGIVLWCTALRSMIMHYYHGCPLKGEGLARLEVSLPL